jgi:hypothetical protein
MPMDFQPVDAGMRAQPEVQPCSPMALIAASAVDFGDLHQIAGGHSDASADGIAVADRMPRKRI